MKGSPGGARSRLRGHRRFCGCWVGPRSVRALLSPWRIFTVFVFIGAIAALVGLSIVGERLRLRFDLSWYDLGWYGFAPVLYYNSFDLPVARVEFTKQDARCSRKQIFLAPRGPAVWSAGALLIDADGETIWRQEPDGMDTQDFKVQEYKGKKVLTYWSGDQVHGRKEGSWFMLDEDYSILHHILPGSTYEFGDMHELTITPDDTALIALYEPIEFDLSPIGGNPHGYLLDSKFQEINVTTGEVLFEWSSIENLALSDTYKEFDGCGTDDRTAYGGCGDYADSPFDWHHLNSIQKDNLGNYYVSGRNLFALHYVDGKSGEVLWNLGGKRNDFKDLSDGRAIDFSWQHYPRVSADGETLSLFDNRAHVYGDPIKESRALVLDLDIPQRTVKLRHEYHHPHKLRAYSQGSAEILEDDGDNVFVGWGRSAAFSEFSPGGELLCHANFAAEAWFAFAPATSYRILRADWVGRPSDPPSAVAIDRSIFVSWNGATEVKAWRLEGVENSDDEEPDDGEYRPVLEAYRTGFETEIGIPAGQDFSHLRIVALDVNGERLGESEVLSGPFYGDGVTSPLVVAGVTMVATLVGIVSALVVVYHFWHVHRHGQRSPRIRGRYSELPRHEHHETLPLDTISQR